MKNKPYKIEIKEVVDDYVVMNVYENEHKPYPTERIVIKPYEVYIENHKLNNILNELEKWLVEWREMLDCPDFYEEGIIDCINDTLTKLQELKESNEPSFEEMVGFVENVCKDIKNQSTLHEELEEERKTIAKIVGDFKEVINNE